MGKRLTARRVQDYLESRHPHQNILSQIEKIMSIGSVIVFDFDNSNFWLGNQYMITDGLITISLSSTTIPSDDGKLSNILVFDLIDEGSILLSIDQWRNAYK